MSRRILSVLTSFLIVGVAILSISGTSYGAITYVRSNGTGLSTTTTLDIGTPGTDRLVVVFADHESTGTSLTGATVDGKSCTLVTIADNPTGAGNHLEMFYIDEDGLGASSGTVTIAIAGGDATWAVHAHLYTGVDQSGFTDFGIDNTSASTTTATVTGIDVPADGLVVMGSGEGQGGLTATWTSPLVTRIQGGVANPSSADMADASAVESTQQTNKTYICTWSGTHNRATAIVAVWPEAATEVFEVENVSSGSTVGTTITIPHTTSGTNRLMLVGVSFNNDNLETVTGITYNSVPLTLVGTDANSDDARIEIWRLIAPDTGTHDVVVTFSADLLQEGFAGVVTFTGVDQTTPLGTFASAAADGITATVDVSSATGEIVFDTLATEYPSTATVGAGQTEQWKIILSGSIGAGSTEPGAATVTMSWTLEAAGDHWAIGAVPVKPVAAAPDGTLTLANHTYGQVSDKFTATSPLTDVLYRFRLTRTDTATVDNVRVNFTTGGGVANSDVSNGELWEDVDNDSVVDDPGDTLIQGSVTPSSGVLTFTSNFSPSTSGTRYLVRATVSNLTGGDATTFSVGTADIDEVENVTESGSISNATHTQDSTTFTTNYRSIGTNTGTLYSTGNASISSGTATVTFGGGASLPEPTEVGAVGVGDELVIGAETFYILSRDSATQVTVQSAAASTHSNASYTISRAYNNIQTWENARDGNLVFNEYVEVGVCYKDGPFLMTGQTLFDGSITDSTHYMRLTVAEGQRHNGTAGTGVVVDGQGGVGTHLFNIRDPYTRLEWLEITNIYDNLGQPIITDNPPDADGSLIANILLHDYSSNIRGINIYSSVTVRNCILYDGDFGIRMYEDYITVTMDNNTVYNMSGDGFSIRQTANAIMRNNISVGCGGQDFDIESEISVDPSSGNNLYSTVDSGIHPGTNNQSPPGSLDDLFISISPGSEDLHIELSGHNALGNGQNLSSFFTDDIDGETRSGTWDIGADEAVEVVCDYSYRRPISIQSSQVSGSSDLTNFPALISLSGDWLKTTTADPTNGRIESANGYDIIFKDSTGTTQLDHEIESYDGSASGGTLVAWVRIPTLDYNDDTVIYIYYGSDCPSSSQENVTGVWDSDFMGVWHLGEASGDAQDSTSYGTSGSLSGTVTQGSTGKIDGSYDFYTSGQVDCGDPVDGHLDGGTGSFTVSTWINIDANRGTWEQPLYKGGSSEWNYGYALELNASQNTLYFIINDGGAQWGYSKATSLLTLDTWHHIVGVVDRATNELRIYKDGAAQGTATDISSVGNIDTTDSLAFSKDWGWIDGLLDEIRISDIARSADWIATEYNNQNDPSAFHTVLDEEDLECTGTYSYRKEITIQSSQVSGTSDLSDFPMLISLTGDWLKTTTADPTNGRIENANGYDIIFKDSGDTQLDHEVESYDGSASGGTLVAWVRIPTLDYNDDTVIYMYYGNSCISSSQENVTGVWDSNFVGVWHLKEEQAGSTADDLYQDSTSNNNDGNDRTDGTAQNGKINGGQQFSGDADGDSVEIPHHSSLNLTGDMTISFWMYATEDSGVFNRIVDKGYSTSYYFGGGDGTNDITFYLSNTEVFDTADSTFTIDAWHYAAVTYDSTTGDATLILDGTESGSGNYTGGITGNTDTVYISYSSLDYDFAGYIDEVRISNTDRTVDWLKTEHNNQSNPSAFYTVGDEENLECIDTYSYRKEITIQSSQVSGSSDFTDFPVLVSLSGDWLKTTTADPTNGRIENANGYDIIFKDSTGATQLDHEIERYDGSASGGMLVAWVRIPTLDYNDDTIIYIYYGSDCPSSSTENITGVWDSDYVAVWHLKESGSTVYDSTSNNNDGSKVSSPSFVDGKIGKAYNTTNGYFSVPYSASLDFVSGSMFIECWVKYDDFAGGTDPGIFVWGGGDTDMFGMNDPTTPRFRIDSTTLEAGSASAGTWYYYVGRYTGSNMYTYHNTSQLGNTSKSGNTAFENGTNTIGYRSAYASYINGIIDELRISKTDRGVDYMTTTYNNQNSPATFYNVGSEEGLGGVDLAEHAAGQEADKFGSNSSVTGAELFAFKLTNNDVSQVAVSEVQFQLSSVTGIVEGDFSSLEIYVDDDNDGAIGGGEATTVGGTGTVDAGVTTITFSTSFNIAGSATVNYILKGDVNNLGNGDTVTIDLGTSNITLASGNMGGSAPMSATHTAIAECIYSYWREITIDKAKVSGSSNLTNFPVLISLSENWLKTTAADPTNGRIENASGYDIIFKDSGGTQLDHEIEEYDGTNGSLVAWVRIPTLSYNSNTVIYIYYGNPCISSSQENVTGVWSNNYVAAWHLSEDPTDSSPAFKDSTSNNNDATDYGSMTSGDQVLGKIDGSLDFDGSNDYLEANDSSSLQIPGSFTVSAWINTDDLPAAGDIRNVIGKGIDSDSPGENHNYGIMLENTVLTAGNAIEVYYEPSTGFGDAVVASWLTSLSTGQWYHVVGVHDAGADTLTLFVNAVQRAQNTGATTTPDTGITPLRIGDANVSGYPNEFNGQIDEVRICDVIRSADWIQTEYYNQNNPSGFYTVGDEKCSYSYKRTITIQSNQVSGSSDLTNFPVLISLSGDWLKTTTADPANGRIENANGYDIIFSDQDSTSLFSLDVRVSDNTDDAEENMSTNVVDNGSSDLELVYDSGTQQEVGIRFQNITIPKGAIITNAYIQFQVDQTDSGVTNLTFYGEDIDDAPNFPEVAGNISNRTKTSAFVNWDNVPAWDTVGEAGADQRTPDLSSIIEEIVSRPGWSSGNDLAIIVAGSGERTAEAHNVNPSGAPLLHIEYTTALNHEIEEYDGTNGTLVAWVRIPTLDYNDDTVIYMFYGNSCISSSQENVTGVWNSNFRGVWHLHDDFVNSKDNNSATESGSVNATGQIADGQNFDNSTDYASATVSGLPSGSASRTLSCWFKPTSDALRENGSFLGYPYNGYDGATNKWFELTYSNSDPGGGYQKFVLHLYNTNYLSTNTFAPNNWYHLVVTYDGTSAKVYVNDSLEIDQTVSLDTAVNPSGFNFNIGDVINQSVDTPRDGIIDEVRISDTARSADWIQTEYNNQSNPSNFSSVGDEEELGDVSLSEHAAGQETNNFGTGSSVTGAELFAFKLTNNTSGQLSVDTVQFQLSSVTGIAQGDFLNLEIYVDTNNDGTIGGGETTTVGGTGTVNSGVTSITFSTGFNISASATVNYILVGDVSSLVQNDTVTIGLGTSNIALTSGSLGGSAPTSVTHTASEGCEYSSWRQITIDNTKVSGSTTNTWQVAANERDAWDDSSSGTLNACLFGDSTWSDYGGYQFAVTIPEGATIISAKLKVYSSLHDGATGAYTARINIEDEDNASAFDGTANDIIGRSYYTTTVDWNIPAAGLDTGTWTDSPDIKDLVQYIIDKPGWSSGNYLSIAVWGVTSNGGCSETIRDYSDDSSLAAKLEVTYQDNSGSHQDFPLLVSLSGDWLKTTTADPTNGRITNSNGYDIIFKDTSGTQLDHEIEDYDGINGTLVAWVRIPTLSYNIDTVIYMYYGNSCISSSQENVTGVWDSNYKGVWHFKETPTVDSYAYDSTSNNNDGTFEASMTSGDQAAGQINGSLDFEGTDDYVDAGSGASLIIYNSDFTLEAWAKLDAKGQDREIISKAGDEVTVFPIELRYDVGEDNWQFNLNDGAWQYAKYTQASPQIDTWYHVVGVRDGSTMKIYINGVEGAVTDTTGALTDSSAFSLYIGRLLAPSDPRHFDGQIDEARVSNIVRSADWILTEYNNQNDPSTFYSVGDEGAGCSYAHRRKITIQASEVSGTSDHSNFPVLVNLTHNSLRHIDSGGHVTNSNGYDIVFRASDETTQLDHEIEEYDGTNGTVVAWVRIPTLDYNDDTVIYMYYGNTCISTSQENITGVWNSNYKGVWHLKEQPTVDSYAYDSTSNNNDGTFETSMTSGDQVSGKINGSLDFDGTDDEVLFSNAIIGGSAQWTITAWMKTASAAKQTIYSEGDLSTGNYLYIDKDASSHVEFYLENAPEGWPLFSGTTNVGDDAFHHVAIVQRSQTDRELFVDGQSDGTNSQDSGTPTHDTASIGLLRTQGWTADPFNGIIDEVRISDTDRSADWVQTEYNNQNTPSSFYTDGGEETAGTVTLGNHAAGQETDKFTSETSVTGAELFAFKLTNTTDSAVTVKKVLFLLSAVTGIAQGDFANLELYVDANNDGTIGGGETTTVGGMGEVNAGVTDITFNDDFSISASTTVNYILVGDVSNLLGSDTVTIDLGTSNITITAGHVGGSAPTSATHTADAACEYSSWRQITIDNTKVSGFSDLSNFPLLVSLSGDWLKTTAADPTNGRIQNASGYDIIFKDTSGTQLDHEIEDYDGTNGTLVAWVKIPTLSYNVDTVIYIHYGNPCISSSQENITGVWASNFRGVWHLSESSGNAQDSTSFGTSGSLSGTVTQGSTGKIDGAYDFGTNGEVDCGDPGDGHLDFVTGSFTYSAWINIDLNTGTWQQILYKGGSSASNVGYDLETNSSATTVYGGIADGTNYVSDPETTISLDTWTHIVVVVNRASDLLRIYKNGVEQGTASNISAFGSLNNSNNFRFPNGSGSYDMDGLLDEVRIIATVRSAGWIETEYNNQNDPSTFYSVGDEGTGCSYSHKRKITIQASEVSGTSDHSNFPVLVNLTHNSLRHIDSGGHITNSNGYDIIFRASDEITQLDHEIEEYDGTNGTIVAWIRIPTLDHNDDTVIYMYYGNTCISASQENVTGVWDSNFVGVWHLKEEQSGSTANALYQDSTSNNNDGDDRTDGTAQNGKINGGQQFSGDADGDSVQIPHHSSLNLTGDMTISFWLYATENSGNYNRIVDKGYTTSYYFGGGDGTNDITFYLNSNMVFDTVDNIFTINEWHYAAVTYDSTTGDATLILDGTESGSGNYTGGITGNTDTVYISYSDVTYDFAGYLDEVRISNTDRTVDWLKTEHNNQSTPSNFYVDGGEETAGTVTLGNHDAGQETDKFTEASSVTGAELFAFKLTNTTDSAVNVKKVQFQLSSVTGIAQGDFGNLYIYVDSDNDGTKDAGETTTVGGMGDVNAGVTDITFNDDFSISASTAVNYILVGDVSNLMENDTVTIDLNPTDVTITAGNVGGSAPTSATHTADGQCTFAYRRQITIQSSQVSGTADLTDFPVVVSLSGTWLRTSTDDPTNGHVENSNGYDIIFRASDGKTQLDHEIEDYDGSATEGTLVAWVRIPTLDYNDDTVIYMLYGNPCIDSSTENVTGVWDTNYKTVWHLKEDPSGTPPQINDSTLNNNDGTTGGTMIPGNQVDGKLNGSVDFDGTDDSATMPTTGFSASAGTIEVWANIDTFPSSGQEYIFSHFTGAVANRIYVNVKPDTRWSTGMGDSFELDFGSTLNADTWYHLVLTWDGTNARGYLNGNLDFGPTAYTGLTAVGNIYIASWDTASEWIDGTLDEIRVSDTDRTADWIKTSYNNQNDPSTFYIIGGEETPVPTAVDLISFTATGQDENVLVEWETAQEVDNLGFNLYRSIELGGTYSKLNRRLIPGLLSSVTGQAYSYVDKDVTRSVLYYYMLEDVDLDGTRTMHGPICVDWDGDGTPDDYIEDPDDDTDTDTGEEDPEVSIPDTGFDELESDLTDWTPSNIGGSASWVKLSSFNAYEQDDGVALEWETSYEVDNLGFHIYRELDGKFYRVTPDVVPGSVFNVGEGVELPAGQSYAYWDALSKQTGREFYWLDSIELNGGRASFGPIEPEISEKPIPKGRRARFNSIADYQISKAKAAGKARMLRDAVSTSPVREQKSRAIFYEIVPDNTPTEPRLPPSEEQWALSGQPGVKIYVKEDGWYRVGEPELVAAGLTPGIDPRYLQLYADGVEQSILVTGDEDGRFDKSDAVEFYGTGLNTPFTDAHVYWLVVGSRPGRRLDTPFTDIRIGPDRRMRIPRGLRGRGASLSFLYTEELKERTFYFAALKTGERENFFGSVISTDPVDQLLTLAHLGPSSPRGAMLEVAMQGATDVYHQVRILLNYTDAYDVGFTGQLGGRVEIPISQENLLEGDNIVTLTAQGGSMDISLVDYVRITYWRTYTADDDVLRFTANGGEWLSIGGFSTPGIRVVDITDPLRTLDVRGKVKADGSDYAITIKVPSGPERILFAFTEENIKQPAGIAANLVSSWHELSQRADVVIIGHSDLLESVRPLKELREQQGLSVVLVDVEDLYDEFNFGAKSPWAVKDFLARAYRFWASDPRYLILVGDTSYDPRNYLGYGEFDLMPTKFVDTAKLKTASDDWFVDFNDDELPDMAVGRLPAASAEEAAAVVAKIINYEAYAGFMNEVLLVSDTNDFFNFEQACTKVAELIPGNLSVNEIFRGRSATARADLLDLLNQGQLLVNYFGHGSTQIWNGNLLTYSDALNLTNSPNLPFFINTTCLNGFFHDPYSESLAEGLLKAPLGGAVAVWTSSGLTDPEEQVPMNEELIKLLFNGQGLTIGEAIMGAKHDATDSDVRRTWILFGDPTLRLR